jgi:hypothetical protein
MAAHPVDLLISTVELARRSVQLTAGSSPTAPTPCTEWNLSVLVRHVADSAVTLRHLVTGTEPECPPAPGRAVALRELQHLAATAAAAPRDQPLVSMVSLMGSFELALHSWDLDQVTGSTESLPAPLASTLLELAPVVLADLDRVDLFAGDVSPGGERSDADRLLALFGRRTS